EDNTGNAAQSGKRVRIVDVTDEKDLEYAETSADEMGGTVVQISPSDVEKVCPAAPRRRARTSSITHSPRRSRTVLADRARTSSITHSPRRSRTGPADRTQASSMRISKPFGALRSATGAAPTTSRSCA